MKFVLKRNPFTNLPLDNPNIFSGREQEVFLYGKCSISNYS